MLHLATVYIILYIYAQYYAVTIVCIHIYCILLLLHYLVADKIVSYLDPNSASDLGYMKSIEKLNFIHFDVLVTGPYKSWHQ